MRTGSCFIVWHLGVKSLSVYACVSESTIAAHGRVDSVHLLPSDVDILLDDQLGDALAVGDGVRLVREVDDYDSDFTAIVSVNGSGSVHEGDAMFQRESGAGSDLTLVALRELHTEPCRNQGAFKRLECDGSVELAKCLLVGS